MAENRLLLLRTFFFIGMLLCFSLQSYRSFKKFLDGKSSISESDVSRKFEPLPTFSICSEPPFDGDYMSSDLNISPNFFLFTSYMNTLNNGFAFPPNLSERSSSSHVFTIPESTKFSLFTFNINNSDIPEKKTHCSPLKNENNKIVKKNHRFRICENMW